MQFLKKKVKSVYQYSKGLIKKPTPDHMSGKQAILFMITHVDQQISSMTLERLSSLSLEFHEYTEIFNCLIDKLQQFDYKPRQIKQTLKLMNIICFLMRSGSEEFVADFKKNEDLISTFQKINTHSFQNCIDVKNAKELTYELELIRHRATYIRKLISCTELWEEERAKHVVQRASLMHGVNMEVQGDETINGLKIDVSFDKSPSKSQAKEKQNKKKQQTQCQLIVKPNIFIKPSPVLGNKISNEICT